eukprot:GDKH01002553.1.p1 GENE.GDKH01002553.1~~GDKH01002553.1.p1  ORF type:complete len:477 (+),score=54.39 GDKH01002553.1:96-1526(+)
MSISTFLALFKWKYFLEKGPARVSFFLLALAYITLPSYALVPIGDGWPWEGAVTGCFAVALSLLVLFVIHWTEHHSLAAFKYWASYTIIIAASTYGFILLWLSPIGSGTLLETFVFMLCTSGTPMLSLAWVRSHLWYENREEEKKVPQSPTGRSRRSSVLLATGFSRYLSPVKAQNRLQFSVSWGLNMALGYVDNCSDMAGASISILSKGPNADVVRPIGYTILAMAAIDTIFYADTFATPLPSPERGRFVAIVSLCVKRVPGLALGITSACLAPDAFFGTWHVAVLSSVNLATGVLGIVLAITSIIAFQRRVMISSRRRLTMRASTLNFSSVASDCGDLSKRNLEPACIGSGGTAPQSPALAVEGGGTTDDDDGLFCCIHPDDTIQTVPTLPAPPTATGKCLNNDKDRKGSVIGGELARIPVARGLGGAAFDTRQMELQMGLPGRLSPVGRQVGGVKEGAIFYGNSRLELPEDAV